MTYTQAANTLQRKNCQNCRRGKAGMCGECEVRVAIMALTVLAKKEGLNLHKKTGLPARGM